MFTTQINMAQHDVHPEEAEQALSGDVLDLDYRVTQDGEERWTALDKRRRVAFSQVYRRLVQGT
jgi:hypothetical protein